MTSIHLRPVRESDLLVLERLAVDPLAAGAFDWHGFGDVGARRRRLAEDGFLGRDPRNLAVALASDDGCVGDVSWRAVPTGRASTCWNIGIVILPEFRGRGYGTEAQRLLAGYLFATTPAVLGHVEDFGSAWRRLDEAIAAATAQTGARRVIRRPAVFGGPPWGPAAKPPGVP